MPLQARPLLVLTVFALLSSAAPVAAEDLSQILERSSYSRVERSTLVSFFDGLAEQAVPSELLTPRLSEAIAKSVPADAAVTALEAELASLLSARELLLSVPGGRQLAAQRPVWQRTAILIRAGIAATNLRPLAAAAANRPGAYRSAATLLLSLRNWGLDTTTAARLAAALVESDLADSEFAVTMEILIEARRRRLSPDDVAERLIDELASAGSAAILRERTLY